MAFPALLNFRSSAAYVTDGAGETYAIVDGSAVPDQYPTTRNGITFGEVWSSGPHLGARDRSNTNNPKLAGMWFNESNNQDSIRLDLDAAGDHDIRLAIGEANYARTSTVKIYDNVTLKATISGTTSGANNFLDATGTNYTAANWLTSNTPLTVNFASTVLVVKIGDGAGTATGFLAHLAVSVVAATGQPARKRFGGVQFASVTNQGVW